MTEDGANGYPRPAELIGVEPSAVKSAARTMDVLLFLARRARPAPTRSIAEACGIPKSSAYALLSVMRTRGFVTYFPQDRAWGVGAVVADVASGYLRQRPLGRLAMPILDALARELRASTSLSILHGSDVLCVQSQTRNGTLDLAPPPGHRSPAYQAAAGRAMLMTVPRSHLFALYPLDEPLVPHDASSPASVIQLARTLECEAAEGFATDLLRGRSATVAVPLAGLDGRAFASLAVHRTFPSRSSEAISAVGRRATVAARDLAAHLGVPTSHADMLDERAAVAR